MRLERERYQVVIAYDGEEALLRVERDDPDIILLDLALPELNGLEVLKAVRERYKERWRPVIIISGRAELETVKQCYTLEADHYLETVEKAVFQRSQSRGETIVSTRDHIQARIETLLTGVLQRSHLTKPCTMEQILRGIATMLSLIPLRRES